MTVPYTWSDFIQENVSQDCALVPCAVNFDWTAQYGVAVFGG